MSVVLLLAGFLLLAVALTHLGTGGAVLAAFAALVLCAASAALRRAGR